MVTTLEERKLGNADIDQNLIRQRREEVQILRLQGVDNIERMAARTRGIRGYFFPSQGSQRVEGFRRAALLEQGDNNLPSRLREEIDNCWKRHRKTPWRRTPILTQMGQFIGYEE